MASKSNTTGKAAAALPPIAPQPSHRRVFGAMIEKALAKIWEWITS